MEYGRNHVLRTIFVSTASCPLGEQTKESTMDSCEQIRARANPSCPSKNSKFGTLIARIEIGPREQALEFSEVALSRVQLPLVDVPATNWPSMSHGDCIN